MPQTKCLPHHRIDFEHDLRQLVRKRVCRRLLPRSVQLTGLRPDRMRRNASRAMMLIAGRMTATARADIGDSNSPILGARVWGLRTDH